MDTHRRASTYPQIIFLFLFSGGICVILNKHSIGVKKKLSRFTSELFRSFAAKQVVKGMTFRKMLTSKHRLEICAVISLCLYVVLLSVVSLTHDHCEHTKDQCKHTDEKSEDTSSDKTCIACFHHSNHVGTEVEPTQAVSPLLLCSTPRLYEAVFFRLRLTANAQSRAPPVFSDTLPSFDC